jgi:hypothetical protein
MRKGIQKKAYSGQILECVSRISNSCVVNTDSKFLNIYFFFLEESSILLHKLIINKEKIHTQRKLVNAVRGMAVGKK